MELLIFDSHPVQYRVPVWRALHELSPGSVRVVYATISSVGGYFDRGFNEKITWDQPLLEGYPFDTLEAVRGTPFSGWRSLTGKGVSEVIRRYRPRRILLNGLIYAFDLTVLREARKAGIPLSLRCENQDVAFDRPAWKAVLRSFYYRQMYRYVDRFYYIGRLNRAHYLRHGVEDSQLYPAHYFTVDRSRAYSEEEKMRRRKATREAARVSDGQLVVGFSGKLIPKKNPRLLFRTLERLPEELRSRTVLYFMGSGELETELRQCAATYEARYGVRTIFTGFINQSRIVDHYLAMDILVLPSRQMGETWGLVVNEAMQAGCGAIVSEFVGCGADFGSWERFRVIPDDDPAALARKIDELARYPRAFNWARPALEEYSLTACVQQLAGRPEPVYD